MSKNDFEIGTGITNYLNEVIMPLGDLYLIALKQQIDLEAQQLFDNIKKNCPKDTGKLAESLTMEKEDSSILYGYFIDFSNEKLNTSKVKKGKRRIFVSDVNYHDIAFFIEMGKGNHEGTRFIKKAVRKLKGIDGRINQRFENMAIRQED